MKYIYVLCLFFFITNFQAQNPNSLFQGGGGRVILEVNDNYKGSAYLFNENWNKGMLVLNDSVFSVQDYIKYNAYNDKVVFKRDSNIDKVIEIESGYLTGFSIFEDGDKNRHNFVWLNTDNFEENIEDGFFESLSSFEKTNYVIKKVSKYLFDPARSKGTQPMNNYPLEYKDRTEYFIKNDHGNYQRVSLNKKQILNVLTKNSLLVNKFIKAQKIKFKKEADIVKLMNYYYSI